MWEFYEKARDEAHVQFLQANVGRERVPRAIEQSPEAQRAWDSQSEMETPCTDMPVYPDEASSSGAQPDPSAQRRGRSRTRGNPLV